MKGKPISLPDSELELMRLVLRNVSGRIEADNSDTSLQVWVTGFRQAPAACVSCASCVLSKMVISAMLDGALTIEAHEIRAGETW